MKVLAGDIGGTKTRLAVFNVEGFTLETMIESTYSSRDYFSLDEIVVSFIADHTIDCSHACFGIAGPIKAGRSQTTNLPWLVDAEHLRDRLGFEEVFLLNDLEANAWGLSALKATDFFMLNPGSADARGNAAIISAGTGLGEAGLYWDGSHYHPFASEGGHSDFSPQSELEFELYKFLAHRFGHVSWERLLSGPGLVNIYEFLLKYRNIAPPESLLKEMQGYDPAAVISNAGLVNRYPICAETLDIFIHLYGVEAGNHALKIMATGGVFIGGGIAPKILEKLKNSAFINAFRAKGRMKPLLADIPVKVILNDRTALYGPALYMAQRIPNPI